MTGGFARLDERVIHRGATITLVEASFRGPDGEEMLRDVVRHPGAVSVVPLLPDGDVILVRQFRAALGFDLLEIPAGKRDVPGEPPELTAARELEEEVGYRPGEIHLLAEFHNSPGFSDEHSYVYLATSLIPGVAEAHGVEESHMVIEHHPLASVPELIRSGELTDAKSIIGLTLALAEVRR